MPQPGTESQTITAADVGAMPAEVTGTDGPATLDPAKAATPEEAAAADPHYRRPLAEQIEDLRQLIPGSVFERLPNTKSGEVVVALQEPDGGDRVSGRGATTAEAVAALTAKLEAQGRTKPND